MVICYFCNEEIAEGSVKYVGKNGEYECCVDCYREETTFCDRCGDRYPNDDITIDRGSRAICSDCEDYYGFVICDECGYWETGTINYMGYNYCEDCAEGILEQYFYDYDEDPEFNYLGADRVWYLGVELEVDDGPDVYGCINALMDSEHYYFKRDGSLSNKGFEIVTHPATIDYHMKHFPWLFLCDTVKSHGFKSHDTVTCGLHVHISREAFDRNDIFIGRFLYLIKNNFDDIKKFARRGPNGYCHDLVGNTPEELFEYHCRANRYHVVNLENYDTVEVRIFRGTTNRDTIIATLQLCHILVGFACHADPDELDSVTFKDFVGLAEVLGYNEFISYCASRSIVETDLTTEQFVLQFN